MSYKTICTVAAPDGADALEGAIACAARWGAHLDVVCVSAIQFDPPVMVMPDLPVTTGGLMEESVEELAEAEDRVRRRLSTEGFGWSVTSRAEPATGAARSVTEAARFADLAVLPRREESAQVPFHTILETMLYTSRVPLLTVPDSFAPAPATVCLAWDGSDVALAAVRAAMPFLHGAETVEIVTVDPDAATDTSARQLAVMLDRHGVPAEVTELPRRGQRVPEILVSHAADRDADLIVMGAYGTRRLREILLGGVTRAMLETAPVPLFLAR